MENTLAEVVIYILATVGASAKIAAIFNKTYKSKWLNALMKVINVVGGNVFNATNAK